MLQCRNMIVIGITGTIGAGKGTVVSYLTERYAFAHYSVRVFLEREINRRGLSPTRDSMVAVSNELREKYHPGYIIECLYNEARRAGVPAVIESIRTTGEIDVLARSSDTVFHLLAVDASQKLRYERIVRRKLSTDNISFDTFISDEAREMQSTDPNKQNLSGCMMRAEIVLHNDGTKEALYAQVDDALVQWGIVAKL